MEFPSAADAYPTHHDPLPRSHFHHEFITIYWSMHPSGSYRCLFPTTGVHRFTKVI
jgi:hypothetical protein